MNPAFPAPDGSAGAAHFDGPDSLARSARVEALRRRALAAAAPAHPSPAAPAPPRGAAGPWPRPPSCLTAAQLHLPPDRARVAVCGLVIVRQRPGSAKGVLFVTLEDETGVVNVVVWAKVYEASRRAVLAARLMRVTGRIQRDGAVVHVVAETIEDVSRLLDGLAAMGAPAVGDATLAPADEVRRPVASRAPLPRAAAPRAMHPRAQAGLLFRRRPEAP